MTNPNLYFNNYLIEEREKKVFVFLPFIFKCLKIFNEIITPAAGTLGLDAGSSSDEKSSKEIVERVYEGINKSRILLFDLSKDNRYNCVNPNVAYELGIARSIRDDNDILLITDSEELEKEIFFDVRGMNIIRTQKDFKDSDELYKILKNIYEKQKYYQDKRIEAISKLVGGEGIELMYNHGRCPDGYRHFHTRHMPPEFKMAALRLLDLGVVRTAYECYKNGFEYSYDWTSLGRAVMKYMGIAEMDLETYKKSAYYKDFLASEERYKNLKGFIG